MQGITRKICWLLFFILQVACNGAAEKKLTAEKNLPKNDAIGVKFELVTNAMEAPIEYTVAPDKSHRIFITDNKGKVWLLKKDILNAVPFLNIKKRLAKKDKNHNRGNYSALHFIPSLPVTANSLRAMLSLQASMKRISN